MKRNLPPRLLEHCLLALLSARDRETVSGDLLEVYGEHAVRSGRTRADFWYAQQVLSFVRRSALLITLERRALALCCFFTALAGSWLGVMDVYLGHTHILQHEAIAGTIVGQALLTLLALRFWRSTGLCTASMLGSAAIVYLAIKAFVATMRSTDMEGYIVLIAFVLVIQAMLTLLALGRTPPEGQQGAQQSLESGDL